MRQLRNDGGRVLDRVVAGERVTITRDGVPVARLDPLPRAPQAAEVIVARFRRLPRVDPASLRSDVDAIVDQDL